MKAEKCLYLLLCHYVAYTARILATSQNISVVDVKPVEDDPGPKRTQLKNSQLAMEKQDVHGIRRTIITTAPYGLPLAYCL